MNDTVCNQCGGSVHRNATGGQITHRAAMIAKGKQPRDHGTTDEQITEWQDNSPPDSAAWHLDNIKATDCKDALCPHQRLLGY